MREERRAVPRTGIPLRAVVPNAVTALALCSGLFGIRFAHRRAIGSGRCYAILIAAVLDGMDGRIARALRGQTRFGAELDSLSDVIAFGVSPAIILYLWSLQALARASAGCSLWPMRSAWRCAWPASTPGSTSRTSRTNRPAS